MLYIATPLIFGMENSDFFFGPYHKETQIDILFIDFFKLEIIPLSVKIRKSTSLCNCGSQLSSSPEKK